MDFSGWEALADLGYQVTNIEGSVLHVLGDTRKVMADAMMLGLTAGTIVTSTPYWRQRRYMSGNPDEVGIEDAGTFVDEASSIMAGWMSLLDEGWGWVNQGDTRSGSGGSGGDWSSGKKAESDKVRPGIATIDGVRIPRRSLSSIPQRFAMRMTEAGMVHATTVIWLKRHADGRYAAEAVAASHAKRPLQTWEPVFGFYKATTTKPRWHGTQADVDVWEFPPSNGKIGEAPFPVDLPANAIRLTHGGAHPVVDPFGGSGVTAVAARNAGFPSVMVDMDPRTLGQTRENLALAP